MAKVLVVDDSPSTRAVVELALRTRSIEVVSAASGEEAMAQIHLEEPDLVLCDVAMPDGEGYEICEFIRDHPRLARTPVLLMSGVVNGSVLARAAEVRSSDVVKKPFVPDELASRIEGLLGRARPASSDRVATPSSSGDAGLATPPRDAKSLLGKLAALPGVSLAVLVDREGFLIESAGDAGLAPEVAGALATCLAESSADVGRELGQGSLQSMVLEYETGMILVNAAGPATMLATMLRDPGAVGKVRHDVKKTLPELMNAI